jgi:hypothetical protein
MEENLFDYLFKVYQKSPDYDREHPTDSAFHAFCKKHMEENPPVSTTVLDRGLGLALRHGQVVSFIEPEKPKPGSEVRGIFINKQLVGDFTREGVSDTSCLPVTGGNLKR